MPSLSNRRTKLVARGFTPKEAAYDIAIGWISNVIEGYASDLDDIEPPSRRKQVRKQLAKLHNRLLDQSGLDGIAKEE